MTGFKQLGTLYVYTENTFYLKKNVLSKKEHVVQNNTPSYNRIGDEFIWHVHMQGNTLCVNREHVPSEKERVVKKEHVVQKRTRCPKKNTLSKKERVVKKECVVKKNV